MNKQYKVIKSIMSSDDIFVGQIGELIRAYDQNRKRLAFIMDGEILSHYFLDGQLEEVVTDHSIVKYVERDVDDGKTVEFLFNGNKVKIMLNIETQLKNWSEISDELDIVYSSYSGLVPSKFVECIKDLLHLF